MRDYGLQLLTPALGTNALIGDITERALGWQRTKRSQGGDWQGSFRLYGDETELLRWFETMLGYEVREKHKARTTWQGLIYEMEYEHFGTRRIRSLDRTGSGDMMANAMMALYIDENDVAQQSAFATQAQSIARYGRKEEIVTFDGVKQTAAEAARDLELSRRAWPYAYIANVGDDRDHFIDVKVCGYIFTLNWQFVSVQDAADDDLEDYIQAILAADSEFLTEAKTAANTLSVVRKTNIDMRAWDQIAMLTSLGDASNNRYRFYTVPGRKTVYEAISTTPRYYYIEGELYDLGGGRVSPWDAEPAVVRDVTYPAGSAEPGSWLTDRRDFYIEELTAGSGSGLSVQTMLFGDDDLRIAQREYNAWANEERRARKQAKKRKKHKPKNKHSGGTGRKHPTKEQERRRRERAAKNA